jgi:predicted nucleotidyltransferase
VNNTPPEAALRHPAVQRLRSIAEQLDALRERVVFIGGAIAPLLQSTPPFKSARVTKDVDALVATATYRRYHELTDQLRSLGFHQPHTAADTHVHRWTTTDGLLFDLVPAGNHAAASGQQWDTLAIDSAAIADLGAGLSVRHASAPAFLALKFAAYNDRGRNDPFMSHDLEDIVALIASRAQIVTEVGTAHAEIATYVRTECRALWRSSIVHDVLAANLSNCLNEAETIRTTATRLQALAEPI